jgi:hypothetical protein
MFASRPWERNALSHLQKQSEAGNDRFTVRFRKVKH